MMNAERRKYDLVQIESRTDHGDNLDGSVLFFQNEPEGILLVAQLRDPLTAFGGELCPLQPTPIPKGTQKLVPESQRER